MSLKFGTARDLFLQQLLACETLPVSSTFQ
jgi:hypothetical protein